MSDITGQNPDYSQLSEDERAQAERMARIAAQAEAKAKEKTEIRQKSTQVAAKPLKSLNSLTQRVKGVRFMSREERERLALERLQHRRDSKAASADAQRSSGQISSNMYRDHDKSTSQSQDTRRDDSRRSSSRLRDESTSRRRHRDRNERDNYRDRSRSTRRRTRSRSRSRSVDNDHHRDNRRRHDYDRRDHEKDYERPRHRDTGDDYKSSSSRTRSPRRERVERDSDRIRNDHHNDTTDDNTNTVQDRNIVQANLNSHSQNGSQPHVRKPMSAKDIGAARLEKILASKRSNDDSKNGQAAQYNSFVGTGQDMYASTDKDRQSHIDEYRSTYLGTKRDNKKRVIKPSEKFARVFKFEWDDYEDTTDTTNPLYSEQNTNSLLFGRGYLAGVDVREQRRQSGQKYLEALAERRAKEAVELEQKREAAAQIEQRTKQELREVAKRSERALTVEHKRRLGGEGKHWTKKNVEDMTERDWRIFREDFDIRVRGHAPHPLRYWEEANLSSKILAAIRDLNYKEPSPIQRQSIPIGLRQRDIIGVAETGSGKTAAFVIPMLHYIMNLPVTERDKVETDGPLALVMAPTRELALQINEEARKLARHTDVKTTCVVGGASITEQGHILREGVDIVIGTPGRLIECLQSRYLTLAQCRYVVLDEADRMIDMGFEPQVTEVLDAMGNAAAFADPEAAVLAMAQGSAQSASKQNHEPEEETISGLDGQAISVYKRTTIMFSATMPPEVEKLAKKYLHNPITVKIGDQDSGKNKRILQQVFYTTDSKKHRVVIQALRKGALPAIVFVNAKSQCDPVARQIERAGFVVSVLHGGKTQEAREESLSAFKAGTVQVLVATDVAGRGLDIPNVAHVVNYDLPQEIDRYTHRIGRTGRAGKEGFATSFFTDHDTRILYDLRQYLVSTDNQVPNELARHSAAQQPYGSAKQ